MYCVCCRNPCFLHGVDAVERHEETPKHAAMVKTQSTQKGFISDAGIPCLFLFFFSIWVFFHEHSRFTGQQGKGEGIYLTTVYHFHPLHRHLDIRQVITAERLPLHIASSQTRTGNLWFLSASR